MSEVRLENKEVNEDEERIDLLLIGGDLMKGFKKFWWICICLAALFSVFFFIRTVRGYVPMYRAESSFTVTLSQNEEYGESNSTYGFYYNSSTASQMARTFPYILQSDMLTGIVKEELGVSSLNGTISASAIENSNLFTISVVSNNPDDALAILESVIKNYPSIAKYVIGGTKFNIIEPAVLPEEPYNQPDYRREAVKGALAGFMLGFMMILIYALSRRTIRKPEDCKNKLNLNSLGEIPDVRFKQRNKKIDLRLSIHNSKVSSSFKESMRTLSMRISRVMDDEGARTVMITSTVPQEGKSVIALNVAYCLARRGKRVMLVDANLGKPEIRKIVADSSGGELSELIEKGGNFEDYICKGDDNKLNILGNNNPAKKSSRLLGSSKMKKLLHILSENYDYIIIDTAPVEATADSVAMAEYVDMAVYVIKQDEVKIWDIMDGISILGASGIQVCGCILNQVRSGIEGYGYGYGKYGYGRYGRYGYGYGYGKYGYGKYGYGYGSKDSSNEEKENGK